jgi:hypothetical protein
MNRYLFAALIILLRACGGAPLIAQEVPPPTAEAQVCTQLVVWFADGFARAPRKNAASIEPVLVVYNGQLSAQDATITLRPAAGGTPTVRIQTIPAQRRITVDLFTLLGRVDADFAVEVEFQGFGTADLKMWSGGHATPSQGLPLCR